jgi:hypothetical protein
MGASRLHRILAEVRPPILRAVFRLGELVLPSPPFTPLWLDYLAANRTAALDTLPRAFGLQPARMEASLDYLRRRNWAAEWLRRQLRRSRWNHG